MTEKSVKICVQLTKMPEKIQNKYLCQLHELDITTKLKILDLKPSIFHKLRSKNSGVAKNIIEFSALILAIKEVIDGYDETSLNAMKLNISRKSASKRDKLLGYWSIVCFLKLGESNTMSFRDIQKYLKKHHRFNISHVSIQQTWNEIEKNKENENE